MATAACGKCTCTDMVNLYFCSQKNPALLKYLLIFGNHCWHLLEAREQILYQLSCYVFIYSFIPYKLDKDPRVVAFSQAKNVLWIFGLNYIWLLDFCIIVLYNKAIGLWPVLNTFFSLLVSLHFQFVLMKNTEYNILSILLASFSVGFIFLLLGKLQACVSQGFFFVQIES